LQRTQGVIDFTYLTVQMVVVSRHVSLFTNMAEAVAVKPKNKPRKHKKVGITHMLFANLLISSGSVSVCSM